jgi:hypothetical protein
VKTDILALSNNPMNYKNLVGVVFILVGCCFNSQGQAYQRYTALDDNWYYFDDNQRHQSYELSDRQQEIFLTIDRSVPDSARLRLTIGAHTSLFINKKIVDFKSKGVTLNYAIDSLFERHIAFGDQLTIMLRHSRYVTVRDSEIVRPVQRSTPASALPLLRGETEFENALIVLVLVILTLLTYIKLGHDDIWRGFMNWSGILSLKDHGDNIYKLRPFEKGTFIIVFAHALLGATALLGFLYLSASPYFVAGGVLSVVLKWLVLTLLLFVLAYGKYFLVKSFTRLFAIKRASRIHFFNHIRMSMMILMALIVVELMVIFGYQQVALFHWFMNVTVVLLLLKSLMISIKLVKISTFRKFHLFSYLCATEIIPAIILVKITFII